MPVRGLVRGVWVGLKDGIFELVDWQYFKYCAVAIIKNQNDLFMWRLVIVYGSSYEEFKLEVIQELHEVMGSGRVQPL
jgi:hypothetical protein